MSTQSQAKENIARHERRYSVPWAFEAGSKIVWEERSTVDPIQFSLQCLWEIKNSDMGHCVEFIRSFYACVCLC